MAAVYVATIEHGEPRVGGWCDSCALPSVVEFDVLIISEHGVSTLGVYRFCVDCEPPS